MPIKIKLSDLKPVGSLKGGGPRAVSVKNVTLLNELIHHREDALQFVRDQVGFPVYLADVTIEHDGTIVLRSEDASRRLDVARKKAQALAAAPAKNCICGLGC